MLDVAIIGGGLCGLALAHSLHARGCDWRLYEARERLGGRVLTATAGDGTPVDLGPTWFWPDSQPAFTRLVANLGLKSFDQLDDGRVLHLADPNRVPQTVALTEQLVPADDPSVPGRAGAVHGGARRVVGGVGAVIGALAEPLPTARLRTGHRLDALVDHGEFVELRLRFGEAAYSVNARRVVLALPPRVAEASVQFVPDLAPDLRAALQATPTWMATAAKAGFTYARAFWRDSGHTGNAWVSHSQAMLAEVFDACGPDVQVAPGTPGTPGTPGCTGAALAGFAALGAAQRASFARGRALLLESQMVQLYGPEAADPALHPESFWQDWALEAETCSPRDLADELLPASPHALYGDPRLSVAHWEGRLFFGGTETARQGGGYLEGALSAAGRLRGQLLPASPGRPRRQEAANDPVPA
jgi:monoamine oxidase